MKSKNSHLLEGILKRHPDGFGFLIPDDSSHPDVYIPSVKTGLALTNDRVQVVVQQKRKGGPKSYFGFIRSVLKRNREFVVGSLSRGEDQDRLIQHNLGCLEEVFIHNPRKIQVQDGDLVRAKMDFSGKLDTCFHAELVENLGSASSSAKADVQRVMAEQGIPFDFPEEVLREARDLPSEVRDKDCEGRKDLTDKAFVTIDGATAQDFDDAIFVEKEASFYRLYVAIADVSYYVQEESFLDQEAFERGNSSYFPNFCSPMLPEKLSNDLCSLREGKTRLVMVQEMDLDFKGSLLRSDVYPAFIKSRKRLTYGEAQDILDSLSSLKGEYVEAVREAGSLAQILLKKHIREQALNLDIPETLIVVDEQGEAQDILKEKRLFSHMMIEQFMLAANKAVSAFLEKKKLHFMYRIHEEPEKDKLQILEKFSKILGFNGPFKKRENLIRFLSQYKDHQKGPLINKLILRSLQQARYSVFNKGHYGLNFASYTHFTSPIRRYCDLLIHRQIKQGLSGNPENSLSEKELEKQAVSISGKEQNSVQAERQIKDIKRARFLNKYVGKEFEGYVSSISSFGLFVTLKSFDVEGLVRFQDLKGFWETDEFQLKTFNKRSSYQIHFGDEVRILVVSSNTFTGKVDFQLLKHKGRVMEKFEGLKMRNSPSFRTERKKKTSGFSGKKKRTKGKTSGSRKKRGGSPGSRKKRTGGRSFGSKSKRRDRSGR